MYTEQAWPWTDSQAIHSQDSSRLVKCLEHNDDFYVIRMTLYSLINAFMPL